MRDNVEKSDKFMQKHNNFIRKHARISNVLKVSIAKKLYLWYNDVTKCKQNVKNSMQNVSDSSKVKGGDCMDIYQKANEVINSNELSSRPIDVEKICKNEKIEIKEWDFSDLEVKVKKKISGMIMTKINEKKRSTVIYINSSDTLERQRFTIAHELGHYFLHFDACEEKSFVSFRCSKNENETQANKFAAALLMPTEMVDEEYNKLAYPTPSILADKFKVSRMAMKIKLDEMELFYIG